MCAQTFQVAAVNEMLKKAGKGVDGTLVQLFWMHPHGHHHSAKQTDAGTEDELTGKIVGMNRLCHTSMEESTTIFLVADLLL